MPRTDTLVPMPSRAEHRRETLLRLGEAATALFAEQGPAATVEAIAGAAGMSRRTITRYVSSKEELAFVHPLLWWDVFETALAEQVDKPPLDRLRGASQAIAKHIDADPEPPRQAFQVAASHPELLTGFNHVFRLWVDRLTDVLGPMLPDLLSDSDRRFQSRIVASAIMGMVDGVTREWVFATDVSYLELSNHGFALIEPILDRSLGA